MSKTYQGNKFYSKVKPLRIDMMVLVKQVKPVKQLNVTFSPFTWKMANLKGNLIKAFYRDSSYISNLILGTVKTPRATVQIKGENITRQI